MIAGMGFTPECTCGRRFSTACGASDPHESWCPANPRTQEIVYMSTSQGECKTCQRLRQELATERAAREDAERRLRYYERKVRR